MKKFLVNILFFTFILSLLALIYDVFKPREYRYNYKEKISQCKSASANVIFFGSSRIYRHIIPEVLDTLDLKFFNMGMPSNFPPESYYLIEDFLQHPESDNIKAIVIELTPMSMKNILIPEGNYYLNNSEFYFTLTHYLEKRSINGVMNTLKAKFFRVFNSPLIKTKTQKNIGCNGWLPLDAEKNEYYRYEYFINHKDSLLNHLSKASQLQSDEECNVQYKRLLKLIDYAAQKGTQVHFFISPLSGNSSTVNCLKEKLSGIDILDFGNIEEYPEFLLERNMFDSGHLNTTGALLLNSYLKRDLTKLIKE